MLRGIVIVAVVLACAIGATAAFAFLLAADYFAFATILSRPLAALAAAGTALLFCLIAMLAGKLVLSRTKKQTRRSARMRIAAIAGEMLGKELADVADRYPVRSIGLAVAAEFVLGFSPRLRAALRRFVAR